MRLLILALALLPQCFGAFTYHRSITVNSGQVTSGPHANFPMPVVGTYSYLATVANGGKVEDAQGDDIGFYANSDCSTGKLDWERVAYDATTGAVEFYVEVGSLDNGTVIYMCYGDASVTTDQSNRAGTWNSVYKIVQHYGNGSLDLVDSASNLSITNTGTTAGTGKIGNSAEFDGSADCYSIASSAYTTGSITITGWMKRTWSSARYQPLWHTSNYGVSDGIYAGLGAASTSQDWLTGDWLAFGAGYYQFQYPRVVADPGSLTDGAWYHYGQVLASGTAKIFKNGSSLTPRVSDSSTAVYNFTGTSTVGGNCSSNFSDGSVDELRIATSALGDGWIATEYNSTNSPSSFYTIGAEVGGAERRRVIFIQ